VTALRKQECPGCFGLVCVTKRGRWLAHLNGFYQRCRKSGMVADVGRELLENYTNVRKEYSAARRHSVNLWGSTV